MGIEVGRIGRRIKGFVAKTVEDIKRGHTLEEEAKVKRIITDPSSISTEDLEEWKRRQLKYISQALSTYSSIIGDAGCPNIIIFDRKMNEVINLTREQLAMEVLEAAKRKVEEWKITILAD